jgi:hypothetical protein
VTRGQQFHRHDIEPRQTVTNRLKLVVEFLSRAFEEYRDEREIRLLSVASGSAQAVIRAMRKAPHLNVRALLIDMDETARSARRSG